VRRERSAALLALPLAGIDNITRLINSGMDVCRISNFSHERNTPSINKTFEEVSDSLRSKSVRRSQFCRSQRGRRCGWHDDDGGTDVDAHVNRRGTIKGLLISTTRDILGTRGLRKTRAQCDIFP